MANIDTERLDAIKRMCAAGKKVRIFQHKSGAWVVRVGKRYWWDINYFRSAIDKAAVDFPPE